MEMNAKTDYRNLEVFYWVARLGSFRKTAEKLNTTQPAISQRVARLEADFGVQLLVRGARVATLTAKGRELIEYIERMMQLTGEMARAVVAPEAVSGVVRIGVSETIVHTWLARFLERVHADYPNVILDIEVDVSPNLRDAVVNNRLDMAFLLGPVSDPTMRNLDLCRYPLAFIAKASADFGPEPLDLPALVRQPLITYYKTTRPYIAVRQLLSRTDLPPPRIYSNSSLSSIVRMTLEGIGVSVIPPVVVSGELARGELRVLRTNIELPDLVYTGTLPILPGGSVADPLMKIAAEIARQPT